MQKVYIRGVHGRGKEVIAKLEALGGINVMGLSGKYDFSIYYINQNDSICSVTINSLAAKSLSQSGTEIFLDEPKGEPKQKPKPESVNILKMYDPVMVSNDGKIWHCAMYYKSNIAIKTLAVVKTMKDAPTSCEYKYIVPCADFNYDNLMSNIKRSIV